MIHRYQYFTWIPDVVNDLGVNYTLSDTNGVHKNTTRYNGQDGRQYLHCDLAVATTCREHHTSSGLEEHFHD